MSKRYGGETAHNQYCKITQWIAHHKDHGDPKYSEAVSDLCLDSWLSPSRYPGLTFLYQTNKKLRKEFGEKVFTKESRDACEEFKRYILPDIFETCEDFQKKDVGNVLGYKYEVKSCDKHKVVFENGMEIHPLLSHNSYEPLNPKLKDIIRIYYVVKGEPDESGDPYKIPRSMHKNRSSGRVTGGGPVLLKELSSHIWNNNNLSIREILLSVKLNNSRTYIAKDKTLDFLVQFRTDNPHIKVMKNILIKSYAYTFAANFLISSDIILPLFLSLLIPDEVSNANSILFIPLINIILEELNAEKTTIFANENGELREAYIEKLRSIIKEEFNTNITTELSQTDTKKVENFTNTMAELPNEDLNQTKSSGPIESAAVAYGGIKQNILFDQLLLLLSNGVLWGKKPEIEEYSEYRIVSIIFSLNLLACEVFLGSENDSSFGKKKIDMPMMIRWFDNILNEISNQQKFLDFGPTRLKMINMLAKNSGNLALIFGNELAFSNFNDKYYQEPQSVQIPDTVNNIMGGMAASATVGGCGGRSSDMNDLF